MNGIDWEVIYDAAGKRHEFFRCFSKDRKPGKWERFKYWLKGFFKL